VSGLPAYFLGNQGGSNAMFLPVSEIWAFCVRIEDFNWKSMRVQDLFNEKTFTILLLLLTKNRPYDCMANTSNLFWAVGSINKSERQGGKAYEENINLCLSGAIVSSDVNQRNRE
jgi:hypothetical protein